MPGDPGGVLQDSQLSSSKEDLDVNVSGNPTPVQCTAQRALLHSVDLTAGRWLDCCNSCLNFSFNASDSSKITVHTGDCS